VPTFRQRAFWQLILVAVVPALMILWAIIVPWLRRGL
jgi:hypothetical protein